MKTFKRIVRPIYFLRRKDFTRFLREHNKEMGWGKEEERMKLQRQRLAELGEFPPCPI